MDLRFLVDNTPDPEDRFESEHGLSMTFDADGKRWLMDVGATDLFARNATRMGVDIASADYLILSHAHADHTGGLARFLAANDHAPILLSEHIAGAHYFSTRRGTKRDISIDYALIAAHRDRFIFVGETLRPTPSVRLFTDIPHRYPTPKANATLLAGDVCDDFTHELAVEVETGDRSVVLSSCSHLGVLNTLAGSEGKVRAYVGGLHLVDSDAEHRFETEEDIRLLAEVIRRDYPAMEIYTGHCTGSCAKELLAKELGARFHRFHTGMHVRFD